VAKQGVERRLAAILSADVAGYSRLMSEDEASVLWPASAGREKDGGNVVTMARHLREMTRRELLERGTALGAAFVIGTGFVAHSTDAWAIEVKALKPKTMATLIQLARDIYPHDRLADEYYAAAVKSHDDRAAEDAAHKALIEDGVATLDTLAQNAGAASYLSMGWEADRVAVLHQIEGSGFFQAVRGGLVVGLYNQKEVWPIFGYEGESFSKGGYIDRGFDDIAWL
jgi:hypothetical protein